MSTSSKRPDRPGARPIVAVIGSNRQLDTLAPLRQAYRRRGVRELTVLTDHLLPPDALGEIAGDVDAVLLPYPRHRSPSTIVPWPAVPLAGRRVPVGLVADHGDSLATFAAAAAAVHDRDRCQGSSSSVAILAQRSRRYLDLAARIRRLLADGGRSTESCFWWPADEIVRDDMTVGLGYGLAVALYVGHGRPSGWVGYAGVRGHHLARPDDVCGVVVSLACHTMSRRRIGLSFGERLVAQGTAAAAIGAVSVTRHVANARWALRFVDAITAGAATAGDLLVAAEPDVEAGRVYRLAGDPLAPLLDAAGARVAARALSDDVIHPALPNPERTEIPA